MATFFAKFLLDEDWFRRTTNSSASGMVGLFTIEVVELLTVLAAGLAGVGELRGGGTLMDDSGTSG